MVENGSNGGVQPLLPRESHNESHDKFRELCAIATTGSLSAEESRLLKEHLALCPECRETLVEYAAVIAEAIPAMAPEPAPSIKDNYSDDSSTSWSLHGAEMQLFERLDQEDRRSDKRAFQPVAVRNFAGEALWRHMWWQYAAGLLLSIALGIGLYRVGIRRGTESASLTTPPTSPVQPIQAKSNNSGANQILAGSERGAGDAEIAALRAQLADRSAEIARLKEQQAQISKRQSDSEAERTRVVNEQAESARQLQLAQAELKTVQQKLDSATGAESQDAARANVLEAKVNALTEDLRSRDRELAREQELLDHDRDIRELMGSRDLYIADVYDVAKTGDTQKSFGRVFYSRGKTLKFYAFDLDQQPGITTATTFQAWGRRGPDQKRAVNLGILFEDDASKKRWVLKADNPKTLAEIDAVFVTVEPNGGSQHPSGKPFLFAYLKVEPNHP